MANDINFSSFELFIDDQIPNAKELTNAFTNAHAGIRMHHDEYSHEIVCEVIDDRFYWIYSSFGKTNPHPEYIINEKSFAKQKNPRTEEEFEPNKQIFAIYDSASGLLYTSNSRQIKFIKYFFEEITGENADIKSVFKDIKDFVKVIKKIESIKFTGSRELLNHKGNVFTSMKDIFGYFSPDTFVIEAKGPKPMDEGMIKWLLNFAKYRETSDIKTLVCTGKDDQGFGSVFNTDSFTSKIKISVQKNDESLFPSDDVKKKIIIELEKKLVV